MSDKKARRNTRQRQVVLEELKRCAWHPTAAELYEFARRRLPKLSLGTVYRNLELLAADGVIQNLETSGTESRFDGNPERHHHVRCVRCGRVDDVHGVPADLVKASFRSSNGYEIIGHRLEFAGICPACKGTGAEKR
jgi:Fur family ferric uptake transcriptional regulator